MAFWDKWVPNEITDFANSAADKLMPKEIAPYMSVIAPMLAPWIGPYAHVLAQLGSAKMNDGGLDPFAALAVHGASSTATARDLAASYDPSVGAFAEGQGGNLWQRTTGAAGDWAGNFSDGKGIMGGTKLSEGNWFSRALQPTQSIFGGTSSFGDPTLFGGSPIFKGQDLSGMKQTLPGAKYLERPADILRAMDGNQLAAFNTQWPGFDSNLVTGDRALLDQQLRAGIPEQAAARNVSQTGYDATKGDSWIDHYNAKGDPVWTPGGLSDQSFVEGHPKFLDKSKFTDAKTLYDSNPKKYANMFEMTPGVDAMPSTNNWFEGITDTTMDFFMPELDETQQFMKALKPGKNFSAANLDSAFKAMTIEGQTAVVGSMAALTQVRAVEKAIRDEEYKNKKERNKVYKAYFDNYEKHGQRKYNDPKWLKYKDPEMVAIYEEIYGYRYGGRVNKNMGGIMQVPGVPQDMELDYRTSGGFIPMGGPEKADDVPAMLSKNEFVLTADAMRGLDRMMGGQGDPRAAAKQMYQMMQQMEARA